MTQTYKFLIIFNLHFSHMKNLSLLLLISFISFSIKAQHTFVPDDNFEQALIDLGYDDTLDDLVLTSNISSIVDLDVKWKNISDMTGIEDFKSLNYLNVGFNQLTSLDLSQNAALEYLFCELNQLTDINLTQNLSLNTLYCRNNQFTNIDLTHNHVLESLEIQDNQLTSLNLTNNPLLRHLNVSANKLNSLNLSNNPGLRELFCSENQLTTFDISHNTEIYNLSCGGNSLTHLDLSQNVNLIFLICQDSQELQSLNVKNGNNTNILNFTVTGNPKLNCIQVDAPIWSEENWVFVDEWVSFSEKCIMSNDEEIRLQFQIYPNPSTGILYFSEDVFEINIYDYTGRRLNSIKQFTNQLDISFLKKGNYILKVITQTGTRFTKQIIKN